MLFDFVVVDDVNLKNIYLIMEVFLINIRIRINLEIDIFTYQKKK